MPQYRNYLGYSIYYWSNEGSPLEPMHFHIAKKPRKDATKVWILSDGSLQLEKHMKDVSQKDLKRIMKLMSLYADEYVHEWEMFFGEPPKYIR